MLYEVITFTCRPPRAWIDGCPVLSEFDVQNRLAGSRRDRGCGARSASHHRNRLDGLVYSVEKTLGEHKEKLSADELGQVNSALEEAKKALEQDEAGPLQAAAESLEKATHKLAEVMYP